MQRLYRRLLALVALFSIELLAVIIIFLGSFAIFGLVWKKFIHEKEEGFDHDVFDYVDKYKTPGITSFMNVITFLGSFNFLLAACSSMFVYFLFIKKHHWYSLKVPVVAIGSILLNLILKYIFSRERPLLPMTYASGFSFPSGHAMLAFSFYGLLIYITLREISNKYLKYGICILLLIIIHLIGFSRIYLRVHYASDVMAGFALGVIWLLISIIVLRQMERVSKKRLDI